MNEQLGLSGDERGGAGPGPVSRQRWRTIVAVVLIVLGCVLAPLAGLLLVALALIEFLGQPPQPTVASTTQT